MSSDDSPAVEELYRFQVAIRLSSWRQIQSIARAERRTPREQAALLLESAAGHRAPEPVGHAA